MATIVTRSGKGSALTFAEGDANFTNLNTDKIELDDISVTTGASAETSALSYNNTTGVFTFTPVEVADLAALDDFSVTTAATGETSSLAYNNTTGVFTFTPVDTTDLIALDDISVTTGATGETAALSYNNTTGVFTFTPVDTTDLIALDDLSVGTEATASGNGAIAYNNTTGVFTYTPPTLAGLGASSLGGNLDVAGYSIVSSSNGNIVVAPNGTGEIQLNGDTSIQTLTQVVELIDDLTFASSIAIDHTTAQYNLTLTGACTITGFSTPTAGATVTLYVQGGSGTNTLSFSETNSTFYINGGANPTMTGFDVVTITCVDDTTDDEIYFVAVVSAEEIV